jgi:hypothetical protein
MGHSSLHKGRPDPSGPPLRADGKALQVEGSRLDAFDDLCVADYYPVPARHEYLASVLVAGYLALRIVSLGKQRCQRIPRPVMKIDF